MKRYIIVTASSVPTADDLSDEAVDMSMLDILSAEGEALLFNDKHDAEDFMDAADLAVEMVVIEAPESITGIIVA